MPTDGDELKSLAADLKKATDNVKSTADKTAAEIKNLGDVTAETKAAADKALVEMNTLAARVGEVELQLARRPGNGGEPDQSHKSVGQQVVEAESFKNFAEGGARGTIRVNVKAITSATGSGAALIQPDRRPDVIPLPRVRLTIRDLLAPGTTTSNSIEYVRQTAFTNAAAVVAEGAQKPESNITWTPVTTPVRTIAHWVPVSRQAMDDAAQLMSLIDTDLRYGLDLAEEREILSGDGTGQHLNGLITQATEYAAAFTPTAGTRLDTIRLAILQSVQAGYPANGIVINPLDWAGIELTKTSEGAYLFANPTSVAGPRLWGLPVVETPEMDADTFLVGAFNIAAQIFDRMGTEVLVSSEDRDNFVKNMLTVRAEKRLALAVKLPAALVYGDFGLVA